VKWKKIKWEMDGETQKDTRRTVQEKDNAPLNNQSKVTKNRKPEEANFVKKQVSLCIQHVDLTMAETLKLPSNQCPQI
jgi:hypothetical protein